MEKTPQAGMSESGIAEQEKSLPTTQELQQQMEGLKARVEAAKLQKEKDVEQKITDRESLIGESKRNDELLTQASETLDYFTSMQELGELKDGADAQKLEELKTLVASLEQKRLEIDQKIDTISSRPEILDKLQDSAKKEDVERAVNATLEQGRKEFEPRIDQINKDIEVFVSRLAMEKENERRDGNEISAVIKQVERIVEEAKRTLDAKSELPRGLDEDLRNGPFVELRQRLVERRKSLGLFKGKEKAVIDSILSQIVPSERTVQQGLEKRDATGRRIFDLQIEGEKIKSSFQSVMADSWGVQDKLAELTGVPTRNNQLGDNLRYRTMHKMEELADLQRTVQQGERWTKVGKYEGWYNANRSDPKNEMIYSWYDLASKTDTWTDSRKKESVG